MYVRVQCIHDVIAHHSSSEKSRYRAIERERERERDTARSCDRHRNCRGAEYVCLLRYDSANTIWSFNCQRRYAGPVASKGQSSPSTSQNLHNQWHNILNACVTNITKSVYAWLHGEKLEIFFVSCEEWRLARYSNNPRWRPRRGTLYDKLILAKVRVCGTMITYNPFLDP